MTRHGARRQPAALRPTALALACAIALTGVGWSRAAHAAAAANGFAEFDSSMLAGGATDTANLARFAHGNPILPGIYNLDVYLNQNWVGRMNVRFAAPAASASAVPCITPELLAHLDLEPAAPESDAARALKAGGACVALSDVVPDATFTPDIPDLRIDASVPQAYTHRQARGYVRPAALDRGVTAFVLNYDLSSYRSSAQGQSLTSTYLGLRSGLNIAGWQLRQDGTATWMSGSAGVRSQRHWQSIDTYARRPIAELGADLTLGDSFTDGAVFDSYAIRGVQLATNDQMLPQSLRGYAPIVRGVAHTNAKVTVYQNGVQIYQTTVAPGPFVIDDLYPTGYGGDLNVVVAEANGQQETFKVPYAAAVQSLRPGITRFDLAAGQLRNTALHDRPGVLQGAVQRGVTNVLTAYAGAQAASGYGAALVGGAFNTRLGAIAVDLTAARAQLPAHGTRHGQSLRLAYTRIISATDTSLSVAAYRYSTSGFLSLTDAAAARDLARRGIDALQWLPTNVPLVDGVPLEGLLTPAQQAALGGAAFNPDASVTPTGRLRQRNRFTLSLSQRLGAGNLYANVDANDYWNHGGRSTQFQLGYNNHFRAVAWGLSLTRGRTYAGRFDNELFFNASLSLGRGLHAPTLIANLAHDDAFGSQQNLTVSGSAGDLNQWSYGATASHAAGDTPASVTGGYRGSHASLSAGYGQGPGYSQASFGAAGSIVAYPGGVSFGQATGNTLAIVRAPGTAGATINNAPGLRMGASGYLLVPYLTPYQLDTIHIDPNGMSLGTQLDATSASVVPYQGAVVMVDFKTETGRPLILRVRLPDGKPAPFGAEVRNPAGRALGVVGQAGMALLRGVGDAGALRIEWQDAAGAHQRCSFDYRLPRAGHAEAGAAPESATCAAPHAPKENAT